MRVVFIIFFITIGVLVAPIVVFAQGNRTILSFSQAKHLLYEVYKGHEKTFYCNKDFTNRGKIEPQLSSNPRSGRMEVDHVVAAEAFGHTFKEWTEGSPECKKKGRHCAEITSPDFRRMESDLYNLVPSVGEVNALKSNYPFGLLSMDEPNFEYCGVKVYYKRTDVPEELRGFVARIFLYMSATYPDHFQTTRSQSRMVEVWDERYPVSEFECLRAQRISEIQGNENPYVKSRCEEKSIDKK